MTSDEIWSLPVEMRMAAFIDRWKDLEEHTGCRTPAERDEMAAIADAIMPALIDAWDLRHPHHPTKNVRTQKPFIPNQPPHGPVLTASNVNHNEDGSSRCPPEAKVDAEAFQRVNEALKELCPVQEYIYPPAIQAELDKIEERKKKRGKR